MHPVDLLEECYKDNNKRILSGIFTQEILNDYLYLCNHGGFADFRNGNNITFEKENGYSMPSSLMFKEMNKSVFLMLDNKKQSKINSYYGYYHPEYFYYFDVNVSFKMEFVFEGNEGQEKIDNIKIYGVDEIGDKLTEETNPFGKDFKSYLKKERVKMKNIVEKEGKI